VLSGGFSPGRARNCAASVAAFWSINWWPAAGIDKHRLVPLVSGYRLPRVWRWKRPNRPSVEWSQAHAFTPVPRPDGRNWGWPSAYELSDGQPCSQRRNGAGWLLASATSIPYPLLLAGSVSALAQLRR